MSYNRKILDKKRYKHQRTRDKKNYNDDEAYEIGIKRHKKHREILYEEDILEEETQ